MSIKSKQVNTHTCPHYSCVIIRIPSRGILHSNLQYWELGPVRIILLNYLSCIKNVSAFCGTLAPQQGPGTGHLAAKPAVLPRMQVKTPSKNSQSHFLLLPTLWKPDWSTPLKLFRGTLCNLHMEAVAPAWCQAVGLAPDSTGQTPQRGETETSRCTGCQENASPYSVSELNTITTHQRTLYERTHTGKKNKYFQITK